VLTGVAWDKVCDLVGALAHPVRRGAPALVRGDTAGHGQALGLALHFEVVARIGIDAGREHTRQREQGLGSHLLQGNWYP
jgi:hypothetical protein